MSRDTTILTINGEEIPLIPADLEMSNLSDDMDKIAPLMAYWGEMWGAAIDEFEVLDAKYRQWRSRFFIEAKEKQPKWSETRIKSEIEADDEFVHIKKHLARCKGNIQTLGTRFDALKTKGSQLQSKGANARANLESTGMSTPATPTQQQINDERREALKDAVRAKNKKKAAKKAKAKS